MRSVLICFSVLIALSLPIARADTSEVVVHHAIMANAEGMLVSPKDYERPLQSDEAEEYIQTLFVRLRDYGRKAQSVKLLLFVHGGLNLPSSSVRRAACVSEAIMADVRPEKRETARDRIARTALLRERKNACLDGSREPEQKTIPEKFGGYYPIFVNWRSGLFTSYGEHLLATRQGERWGTLGGWATSPFVLIGDLGRAVFRAPMVWIQGVRSALHTYRGTPPFGENEVVFKKFSMLKNAEGNDKSIALSIGSDHGPRGIFGPAKDKDADHRYYNGIGPDGSWLEGAVNTTSWLITLPTKAVAAPAIDSMGKPAWDIMSRRTELLRRQPSEFDDVPGDADVGSVGRTGAVAHFLDRLILELGNDAYADKAIEITIIGHSMGTIVANWIIADYGIALKPANIVYLASASTIREFEKQVIPYLASSEGQKTKFYNLTLHPRAEVRERNADIGTKVLDLAPRGSLLVWIDNYLSNPESFLDRTLGRWDNIIAATHIFPEAIRDNVNIKAFGICHWGEKQPEENPEKHGEFSDGEFWRPEYWSPTTPIEKCGAENRY